MGAGASSEDGSKVSSNCRRISVTIIDWSILELIRLENSVVKVDEDCNLCEVSFLFTAFLTNGSHLALP